MPEITKDTLSSLATAAPPEEKPILFGKYELGRLLGCGGFAKVYHGRDLRSGKSVAIKCISKSKISQKQLTTHIKREISIMRRLHHPHIIRLFEVLATKTKVYFVLEFAKGGEVFAKVSKGRFSEDLSRRFFLQLISAVGYCHSRGIYHRDLKLENLLLDENWNLKVTDFGLGAIKDQTRSDKNHGLLQTSCGTPAYVAPEILAKKGYDGAKADIWSCGIILFVLSAGFLPFNDTNLMNLYRKIYRGEFRCPKFLSLELKDLLFRLLNTDPESRITIEGIIDHPWVKKGEGNFEVLHFFTKKNENEFKYDDNYYEEGQEGNDSSNNNSMRFLNAFDLISYSSGFDLSGLFMKGEKEKENCWETFLSKEVAEIVVEKVEEAALKVASGAMVERSKCGMGVKVEGQNGDFGLVVDVRRLTEDFVVVQVRKRGKDVGPSHKFWKEKLRPKLLDLVYKFSRVGPGLGPSCKV